MSYENNYENEVTDSRECEAMRKMFVGGLNRDTSEEVFFQHFEQYGNLVDKVIIKDPHTKQSRGFGFITYDSSESVEAAFQARPHYIDGKTLDIKRAMPRDYNTTTAHSKVTKLFIGGIAPDLTPMELQQYIEDRHPTSCGTVDKIDFLKDRDTNKNKGFGFLECSNTDFADRLTISENSFQIKNKSMSLKKAEPKPEPGGGGGRGGGRGGGPMRGGRGRGGGRGAGRGGYNNYNQGQGYGGGQAQNNDYNNYSTAYPQYGNNQGGNQGGYNNYSNGGGYGNQEGYGQNYAQGNYNQGGGGGGYDQYGAQQASYGGAAGAQRGGRYQPY